MKKIVKFLKLNIKLFLGIIVGMLTGTIVYAATILLDADQVGFDKTGTNLTSTNIQAAIKKLDAKSNTWINPSVLNGNGYYINSAQSMIATSQGILLVRNGNTHFIKADDWANEQTHIQQVFSDVSCDVDSYNVDCDASDFWCDVDNYGGVRCYDKSGHSNCSVYSGGNVACP